MWRKPRPGVSKLLHVALFTRSKRPEREAVAVVCIRDIGVRDGHAVFLHRGCIGERLGGGNATETGESGNRISKEVVQAARSNYRYNVLVAEQRLVTRISAGFIRQNIRTSVRGITERASRRAVNRDSHEVFRGLREIACRFACFG